MKSLSPVKSKILAVTFRIACGLILLAAAAFSSRADEAAINFAGAMVNGTTGAFSLGFEFTTNTSINVGALGYYNASLNGGDSSFQNGTCACGEVGIFNSTGTLLASTTVTGADPVSGFFNYAAIPTLTLAAGQTYFIMAETGTSDYTGSLNTGFVSGFSSSPDINYVTDAYVESASLAFPSATEGLTAAQGGGEYGPNFMEVPEPASLPLLGAGLLFLVGVIRRK